MNTTIFSKSKLVILSVISVFYLSACTDLSETVYSDIPMDKFFTSEQALLMNAGRAYTKLQPYPVGTETMVIGYCQFRTNV